MATTPHHRPARARLEDQLLEQVRDMAGWLRWRCYHTHRSDRSEPGFPDVVLVRGDRVVWRELKTSTGKVSVAQQAWLDDLQRAGQDVGVWRPEDWTSRRIESELRAR